MNKPSARPKQKPNRAMNIALVAGAMLVGAGLSVRPWKVYQQQKARTAEYQKQMREAEQRRVDLTREKAKIDSPLGMEQAAREQGFIKPGEQPLDRR